MKLCHEAREDVYQEENVGRTSTVIASFFFSRCTWFDTLYSTRPELGILRVDSISVASSVPLLCIAATEANRQPLVDMRNLCQIRSDELCTVIAAPRDSTQFLRNSDRYGLLGRFRTRLTRYPTICDTTRFSTTPALTVRYTHPSPHN